MEEKKAYWGANECEETRIHIPEGQSYDNVNPWRNEVWSSYYGKDIVYHKKMGWRNTWLKYGYVREDSPGNSTNIPSGAKVNHIEDLQDYFESGGCLQQLYHKMSPENQRKILNDFYEVMDKIDFTKHRDYYNYRWRGLIGNSWEKQKGIRVPNELRTKPVILTFRNTLDGKRHLSLSITSFFAGTNIDKVELRFDENTNILNAQKLFYRMCPYPTSLTITDLEGRPIVSSKYRGLSPTVISEMYGDNTTDWGTPRIKPLPTNNLYYDNVHSAAKFVWANNVIEHIPPFNNAQIGQEIEGNILTLHYPIEGQDYISSRRDRGEEFAHSYSLKTIGPLLNLRYARNVSMFNNSSALVEVRIKHLNNDDWNFSHMANLSRESIVFMLTHLWDRIAKWVPYEHLSQSEKARVLNETCVQHQNRLKLYLHANHRAHLTNELLQSADRKGWDIYIGGNKVTSV